MDIDIESLKKDEEFSAAIKLFYSTYDYLFNFIYIEDITSNHFKPNWKSSEYGYNNKTKMGYPATLTKQSMLDVILGKITSVNVGTRRALKVKYLGVKFGKLTRHLTIDIDTNSSYYNIKDLHRIIEVLKPIGNPVIMQSSYSKGWHLRYYFSASVPTFKLAVYVERLLKNNCFTIEKKILEIFPNVKSEPGVNYNGIRLPCQKGSALLKLDKDELRIVEKQDLIPELFIIYWANEVAAKIIDPSGLLTILGKQFNSSKTERWFEEYLELKEKGLTEGGSKYNAIKNMAKGLVVFEGVEDVDILTTKLSHWIKEKHNGHSKDFNSHPERVYGECRRWAEAILKKYKPLVSLTKARKINNRKRAQSATNKFLLQEYLLSGKINLNMTYRDIESLTGIPKSTVGRILKELKTKVVPLVVPKSGFRDKETQSEAGLE